MWSDKNEIWICQRRLCCQITFFRSRVKIARHTHECMFKNTLTRCLENYAGFSEANITQTVVGRGLCVSPQRFAVLLTPDLSLVSAYYSLNWWNISTSQGKQLVSNMFLFFTTHKKNNILSHVKKNYEVHSQNKKRTVKTKTKEKRNKIVYSIDCIAEPAYICDKPLRPWIFESLQCCIHFNQ